MVDDRLGDIDNQVAHSRLQAGRSGRIIANIRRFGRSYATPTAAPTAIFPGRCLHGQYPSRLLMMIVNYSSTVAVASLASAGAVAAVVPATGAAAPSSAGAGVAEIGVASADAGAVATGVGAGAVVAG